MHFTLDWFESHELRKLKNSRTSPKSLAKPGLLHTLCPPRRHSILGSVQRATEQISIWTVQARWKAGTTKQERGKFLAGTLKTLSDLHPAIKYWHLPLNLKVRGKVSISFEGIPTLILSYNTFVRYLHFAVRLQTPRFLLYFSRFWLRAFDHFCCATIMWHNSHHQWQQLFYLSSQNYLLLPCKYYLLSIQKVFPQNLL